MLRAKIIFICSCFFYFSAAFASELVATITKVEGDVEVFSHPGKTPTGPSPHALYEGIYYSVRKANPGDQVENGNLVRTSTDGKALVIYNNGDQITVGTGTAYKVEWLEKNESKNFISLMYGKLRLMARKTGLLNKATIRTTTATLGIRGTDFFISHKAEKGSDLIVFRGKVDVKAANQTVAVSPGQSARVPPMAEKATKIAVRQTTKQDFEVIQRATSIDESKLKTTPPKLAQKVQGLQSKAQSSTLQDIKETDPKLYSSLSDEQKASSASLNQVALVALADKAPTAAQAAVIEVEEEKKKEQPIKAVADEKYKSLPESWYFSAGIGPAFGNASGDKVFPEGDEQHDSGGANIAVLFPSKNERLAYGVSATGGGTHNSDILLIAGRAEYYFGTNIGHSFFVRGEAGPAHLDGRKEATFGIGAMGGGGYAWPVFRGTRLTFSVVAGFFVGPGFTAYNVNPQIGFML